MNTWLKAMVLAIVLTGGIFGIAAAIGWLSVHCERPSMAPGNNYIVEGGAAGDIYITKFQLDGHEYIAAQRTYALALLHSQSCMCRNKEGDYGKESR